ncbi:MAG: CopG family transcriptional regulator [Gammaproteobacteria bacterium]|nr:CopG family transcriptional regulator [Gammaproteobacteria bacterium]
MATNIELSNDADRRLDSLVSQTGRSKAYYLREIVERGLEDIEDYYLGVQAADRVRRGEEGTFSSEEVSKYLGLDD